MAAAALLEPDGRSLTVYLPGATAATAFANLRENGEIAVVLSQPLTHRTVQLKGRVETIRPARESERDAVERVAAASTRRWRRSASRPPSSGGGTNGRATR